MKQFKFTSCPYLCDLYWSASWKTAEHHLRALPCLSHFRELPNSCMLLLQASTSAYQWSELVCQLYLTSSRRMLEVEWNSISVAPVYLKLKKLYGCRLPFFPPLLAFHRCLLVNLDLLQRVRWTTVPSPFNSWYKLEKNKMYDLPTPRVWYPLVWPTTFIPRWTGCGVLDMNSCFNTFYWAFFSCGINQFIKEKFSLKKLSIFVDWVNNTSVYENN